MVDGCYEIEKTSKQIISKIKNNKNRWIETNKNNNKIIKIIIIKK